jgi:hypothetical protein
MATKKFKLFYENNGTIYASETGIPKTGDTSIVTLEKLTTYTEDGKTKKYEAVYVTPIAAEEDGFASYEIKGKKADGSIAVIEPDIDAEYHAHEFVEDQADCIDEKCNVENPDYVAPCTHTDENGDSTVNDEGFCTICEEKVEGEE